MLKKSITSSRDHIAESMGINPATLPPEAITPTPAYLPVPQAPMIAATLRKTGFEGIQLAGNKVGSYWANAGLSRPPIFDWVLPSLPVGEVSIMYSPGGTGKSFWSLQAACTIASGIDCLGWGLMGHQFKKGKVTYLSLEDGEGTIRGRLSSIFDTFPALVKDEALSNFESNFDMRCVSGRDYDLMNLAGGVWDELAGGSRLLVIDTLSQAHRGDENQAKDASTIIQNLLYLARKNHTATLALHHTSKAAARDGDTSQQASRGSTVLTDNIRNAYYMANMQLDETPMWLDDKGNAIADRKNYARWGMGKHNATAGCDDVWFHRSTGGVLIPTTLGRKSVKKEHATHTGKPSTRKPTEAKQLAGKDINLGDKHGW